MSWDDILIEQQNEHVFGNKNSKTKEKDVGIPIVPVPNNATHDIPRHYELGTPEKVWDYKDKNGELLMRVCRFKGDLNKEDRPLTYRQYKNGQRWAYKGLDQPRPLYGLDKLAARPDAPVIICEGEKATDAAAQLFPDCVAITSPNGAKSATSADWEPLIGRGVTVWPDNDVPGQAYARAVAEILHTHSTGVRIVDITDKFPKGWDLADTLPLDVTLEDISCMLLQAKIAIADPLEGLIKRTINDPGAAFEPEVITALIELKYSDRPAFETLRGQLKKNGVRVSELEKAMFVESNPNPSTEPSQADILVDLASGISLFHTESKVAYGDVEVDGHRETYPLRSRHFKHYLIKLYHEALESAPSSEALNAAINVIEAKALFNAPEQAVYIRTAEHDGKLYIDLCLPDWRVVEIDSSGWRVISNPPVRFRRTSGMLPLPIPVIGGSIDSLRKFLNVSEESDFVLTVAWILAALRNVGPYPLIIISGEQGSAKSTFTSFLRMMTDPNTAALRTLPREIRDLYIAANNGYVLAFDNLSYLSSWISDAFCRLSTGGGFATRQLHTDMDEILFNSMRPIILNGIDDVVTRPDLADRSILLTLEPIPEEKRRTEREIMGEFKQELPAIMGAIFDALSHGLKMLPQTHLENLPRMADFALWIAACEEAFWPAGTFMEAYHDNYASTVENVLGANDVASAVLSLLDMELLWTGTAGQLLEACERQVTEAVRKSKSWPRTARAISSQLRRAATFLRKTGIQIDHTRLNDRNRTRIITISRILANDQTESSGSSVNGENSNLSPYDLRTIVSYTDGPDDDDINFGSGYQG